MTLPSFSALLQRFQNSGSKVGSHVKRAPASVPKIHHHGGFKSFACTAFVGKSTFACGESERKASTSKARSSSWPPGKRRLRELVKDAIVDAYNDSEQRTGLFTMIEEHLTLPFETKILGVTVSVERATLRLPRRSW